MNLTIGWLYPKQMSTYGDRGNVITIVKRCEWRGIKAKVLEIDPKTVLKKGSADFYFFGGGQDQAQNFVAEDLQKYKKSALYHDTEAGAVLLGVCGGYQLIGRFYQPYSGKEIAGISLLDVYTEAGNKRMIGNIVVEVDPKLLRTELVGFENHSGRTFLEKGTSALGRVLLGSGNNGDDRQEGAWKRNIFGCYLHGPVLPKNPRFADFLIEKALRAKYGAIELGPLDDTLEVQTHEAAFKRAKEVSRI